MAFDLSLTIPLTEPERRRVEFAGGTPIVMPDGKAWRFFEPRPVRCPVMGEDDDEGEMIAWDFGGEGVDAETNDSLGRGFQRILEKINRAENRDDRTCGTLEAAWYLLARNYVISQDNFEDLLLSGAGQSPERRRRLYASLGRLIEVACARVESLLESAEVG